MAKQALTPVAAQGGNVVTIVADSLDVAFVAASAQVDGWSFPLTGREIVIVKNGGASPYTVTFSSVADPRTGRSGDQGPYTLAAGDHAVFGPFTDPTLWRQADGAMYFLASNIAVVAAVIRLPSIP